MDFCTIPSRILIVEDDSSLRLLMKAVLDLAGHEVLCAGSASEALETLGREALDAVLMDVHLPGMNGVEIYERLCRSDSALARRTILVSASPLEEMDLRRWTSLRQPFLQKPFAIDDLLAAVHQALCPSSSNPSAEKDSVWEY